MRNTLRRALVACLMALLAPLACAAQPVHDAFAYPDGSAGEPAWSADSASWMVSGGRLTFSGGGKSFITRTQSPDGRTVSLEATVQVDAIGHDGWGVAGVAVRHDDENYWHLALVAAPAANGHAHFVELAEDYKGTWNAQSQGAASLRLTANAGSSFAWKVGQPYRLHIGLSPKGVEGTVSDMSGKVLRRIAYAFDAGKPAVKSGRPALDCGLMTGWFDDAAVEVSDALPPQPKQAATFPPYDLPGCAKVHGKATGFFHTEKLDGKWWLIDPNGLGFYAVGVDQASWGAGWCQKLGYSPYHRHVVAQFGTEQKWADDVASRLRSWGFNALGEGYSSALHHMRFAQVVWLGAGSGFSSIDDIVPHTTWTGFPNVFSPRWKRQCDVLARRLCAPERQDPWLLAYCLDGELQWFGALNNWANPTGLFTEAWRKPAGGTVKVAWMGVVRASCPAVSDFNTAWGTKFASFDELAASTSPTAPVTDAARAMARKFARLVAVGYFKTLANAIHRYDPNHMIFSCLFAGWAPDVLDIAGKYCNVISLDSYPRIDVDRGVPQSLVEKYRSYSEQAGRPLAITEWSFPSMDSGLPNTHGAGMRVATQQQRARCFRSFQSTLFGLPFMVGSYFFMYVDEAKLGVSDTFPENSNYGLVDVNNRPWPELTGEAAAVNPHACELHLSGALPYVYKQATGSAWTRALPPAAPMTRTLTAACGPLQVGFDPAQGPGLMMRYSGVELGRFIPLLQQKAPADAWTAPESASVDRVFADSSFTVVDMTFRHASAAGAPAYEAGWRLWFPRNSSGWFAAQSLYVKNTDSRPWTLAGLFDYTRPSIGGSPEGDAGAPLNVPNFYLPVGAWEDAKAGLGQGVVALDGALSVTYWKDAQGFHSDCRQSVNVPLKPGQRYAEPGAVALVFGYRTDGKDALLRAADRVRSEALALQPEPGK